MPTNEISEYVKAIKKGNKRPLEDLAISVGYAGKLESSDNYKDLGILFMRAKKGPSPYSKSIVVYVSQDYCKKTKPERMFFIEFFNEMPDAEIMEKKMMHCLDIKFCEEQAREESDHMDAANFLRVYSHGESLTHGEDAIRYLMALREGKSNELFPLLKQRYDGLIAYQRNKIEHLKGKFRKRYMPEDVVKLALVKFLLDVKGGPILKIKEGDEKNMFVAGQLHYEKLILDITTIVENENHLKRLEQATRSLSLLLDLQKKYNQN